MTYTYFSNCVSWPSNKVSCDGGLVDMVDDAIDISRRTFLQHIEKTDLAMLEDCLSYSTHPKQGMTMAGDWHVTYHRSRVLGERVYYFCHSAIEYVFVPPTLMRRLNR